MKRLQENRIEQLRAYLQSSKLDPELIPEILDHLACEAEEKLWDGSTYEQALSGILDDADLKTLQHLSVDHKNLLAMDNSLDDIVFEGRNKSYGAYMLRKEYGNTMQKSVFLGVGLFGLMVMLPNLYARLVPEVKPDNIAYIVEFKNVDIRPEPKLTPPPPPKAEEVPVAKTVKSVIPTVVPDDQVDIEYEPPVKEDLEAAQPGTVTQDGLVDVNIVSAPIEGSSVESKSIEVAPEKEKEFIIVDQQPEYFGGNAAMASFFQKHLRYPVEAVRAGIQGRVFMEFTVGSDGKVENVKPIKGIGFGCDEEATRVIKLMPAWKPGKQAGKPVRVRYTLPVLFQMN